MTDDEGPPCEDIGGGVTMGDGDSGAGEVPSPQAMADIKTVDKAAKRGNHIGFILLPNE